MQSLSPLGHQFKPTLGWVVNRRQIPSPVKCQSIQSRCQNSFWAGVGKCSPVSLMIFLGLMYPPPWSAHLVSLGVRPSLLEGGWGTLLTSFHPFQLESPQVPQRSYPRDLGIAMGFSNTSVMPPPKKTGIMVSSLSHFHNSSSLIGSFPWVPHGKQTDQSGNWNYQALPLLTWVA